MTMKAMKYQVGIQLKAALIYIGIFVLVIGILSIIINVNNVVAENWMSIATIYWPKIYLIIMGIVYPLITMEMYISRGLTRKQYFWSLTAVTSIMSLLLIVPAIISQIIIGKLTLIFVVLNLVQMPAFFLMGWTAVVGFQHGIWYKAALGLLCAIASSQLMGTIPEQLKLPELASLGITIALIIVQLILLPRFIKSVPIRI